VKLSGQYYQDILPSQQMLSAIQHVADDNIFFQQESELPNRVHTTVQQLQHKTLHLLLRYGSQQAGAEPDMHMSH